MLNRLSAAPSFLLLCTAFGLKAIFGAAPLVIAGEPLFMIEASRPSRGASGSMGFSTPLEEVLADGLRLNVGTTLSVPAAEDPSLTLGGILDSTPACSSQAGRVEQTAVLLHSHM